jgi:hypothetical protein
MFRAIRRRRDKGRIFAHSAADTVAVTPRRDVRCYAARAPGERPEHPTSLRANDAHGPNGERPI